MTTGVVQGRLADIHAEATRLKATTLTALFANDQARFQRFTREAQGIFYDFSREKIDAAALDALVSYARERGVEAFRDAMARGETVNRTEGRAALHMALRGSVPAPAGDDVASTLDAFLGFAEAVREGNAQGSAGRFADVVNIGIGGSDLGPVMAVRALSPCHDGPRVHFVSNVDGAHLADVLKPLDLTKTLFIVASKTFTTQETMANAMSARARVVETVGEERAGLHFAAVSTNLAATKAFGILDERVFGFWEWVGGRFSLWSAVGLSLAIAIGAKRFRAFLQGAAGMDRHFLEAPLLENLPMLFALIGFYRRVGLGYGARALIAYDQRLERFAAFCQQLEMESNGKRVSMEGKAIALPSAPVTFGEPGTNAQHSFFQLLHQGSDQVPVDFLIAANATDADAGHHRLLIANCLSQAQALAFGRDEATVAHEMMVRGMDRAVIDRLAPHRTFPGDRPSSILLYPALTPETLGALIALFEHKTVAEAALYGINPFDQWGVELGKECAKAILPALEGQTVEGLDSATRGMIERLRASWA